MIHLTLLHTNDIHGHLNQLPKTMTLARRIRSQVMRSGGHLLMLDAGDSSDFYSPISEISRGVANLRLLEAMGYAAATVGNWEGYVWGLDGLKKLARVVQMPLLAANLFLPGGEPIPGILPYVWLTPGGARIAVIGATASRIRHYTHAGILVRPAAPIVRELAARLRSEGADLIVFLSHLGYGDTGVPGDLQFAQQPNEVDVIIGGHSHTILNQPVWVESSQTLIAHAGSKGRFLGRIDLTVDEHQHHLVNFRSTLARVTPDVPDDTPILAVLQEAQEATDYRLDQQVGQAQVELPFYPERESPWGDLVADVMRETTHSQLAALLGVHLADGLPSGPIRRRQIRAAIPDKAHIWVMDLSGAQVHTLLARGLDPSRMSQMGRTGGFGQPRRPVGLFQVSNVRLRYRPAAPEPERLLEVTIAGEPLDPARTYQLATLWWSFSPPRDYLADYLKLNPGQATRLPFPGQMLWELVEGWIQQHTPISLPAGGRIVPVV